jgi:tetratricopeptide (TPR) repeat protein
MITMIFLNDSHLFDVGVFQYVARSSYSLYNHLRKTSQLLFQKMSEKSEQLDIVLKNLAKGQLLPSDLDILRQALSDGQITIADQRGVAAGRDISKSIVITGDGNTVTLSDAILEKLLGHEFEPLELTSTKELPEPGTLPPRSRLPFIRNATFVGRQEDLLALARSLLIHPGQTIGIGITQAATGMGGIGKTQLAVEFCYRYGRFFHGVHWVQANQDIDSEIAACGAVLGIQPWPEKQPDQVEVTLRAWQKEEPRLVVLDNLEEAAVLKEWLPRLGCVRVLVTARRAQWPKSMGMLNLPLGVIQREESRELLRGLAERLKRVPDQELDKIADRLGDLPLALSVAGQYLAVRQGMSIGEYLEELEHVGGALKHQPLPDWLKDSPTRHELSLWETFLVSWKLLEGQGEEGGMAARLLKMCGYCAPNVVIPRDVLVKAVEGEGERGLLFDLGLQRLSGLGFVTEGKGDVSVHTLIAEFGRIQDSQCEKSVFEGWVTTLLELGGAANRSGLPGKFEPLRAHFEVAVKAADAKGIEQAGALWNVLGYYLHQRAEIYASKIAHERALAIGERVLGPDHPSVAKFVNNLGSVLKDLGDLSGAKAAFERALVIDERLVGSDHPDVTIDLNNLGMVLQALGDLVGAKAAIERALAINERAYGQDHPYVATLVNNLGSVLQALGDLSGAKAAFERALVIDERLVGSDHPDVAINVNNLGLVLQALGDLSGAQAAFERALAINERVYGQDHPTIARDVNNLGMLRKDLGDLTGAKAAFERALAINEQVYGPDHPDVATLVNNLGMVLMDLGDLDGAKAAFERALAINERVYGLDHPDVATLVNNLGMVLQALGDLSGAKVAIERALAIKERVYGLDHPDVATLVNNLGSVLQALGDLDGAKAAFERALAIDERFYGPDHPTTVAINVNNLGGLLQDLGDLAGAKAAFERALAIFETHLPANHPSIRTIKNNLARLVQEKPKQKVDS